MTDTKTFGQLFTECTQNLELMGIVGHEGSLRFLVEKLKDVPGNKTTLADIRDIADGRQPPNNDVLHALLVYKGKLPFEVIKALFEAKDNYTPPITAADPIITDVAKSQTDTPQASPAPTAAPQIVTITESFRDKLRKLPWRDKEQRQLLSGQMFDQLLVAAEINHTQATKAIDITFNTVKSWRHAIKPTQNVFQKVDRIGSILAPNDQPYAQIIADALLGLPDRKTPSALLKEIEDGHISIGEALFIKRMEKRHTVPDAGKIIVVPEPEGAVDKLADPERPDHVRTNDSHLNRIESNHRIHISHKLAEIMADYMGYDQKEERLRYVTAAMRGTSKPLQNPAKILDECMEKLKHATDAEESARIKKTYLAKFRHNVAIIVPLVAEMVNLSVPDGHKIHSHDIENMENPATNRERGGVFSDIIMPIMELYQIPDNRKGDFIETFSLTRQLSGGAVKKYGHLSPKADKPFAERVDPATSTKGPGGYRE